MHPEVQNGADYEMATPRYVSQVRILDKGQEQEP